MARFRPHLFSGRRRELLNMSTYKQVTRHPQTGVYEYATWHDDYFGPHVYGVEFPSDRKVYPIDLVNSKKIETFWANDIIGALNEWARFSERQTLSDFLNIVEEHYKARWERDPVGGEGAVDWLQRLTGEKVKKVD